MVHIAKSFTTVDRVNGLISMQRLNPIKSYDLIDFTFTISVGKISNMDINFYNTYWLKSLNLHGGYNC